jgi:glycosyltransferase involved in cell wall biosynthesis
MRVLALTKYGTLAASTRQRFLQYEPLLRAEGIELDYSPLLDNDYLAPLLRGEPTSLGPVMRGYGRRLRRLWDARRYDLLWVHCEFFPFLPGWVERSAAKIAGRPIVFDYDDAIFHLYDGNGPRGASWLLDGKLAPLLEQSAACLCGNAYLRDYAAQFCANSIILPTVVDTGRYFPSPHDAKKPVVIGWIGSPSTWPNVRPLLPLLKRLAGDLQVRIRAVGAGNAARDDTFPGLELIDWSESSEIAEVQAMDIGIMPLIDRPFERGKSGYKLIQYMACGIPVVASPVGVNRDIVREGKNGLLATDESEWRNALVRLITDPGLRSRLGGVGRAAAEVHYSLVSQAPRLIEVFKAAAANLAPAPPQ